MQEQFRVNRQILYDLAARYLEPLPGTFARLAYLAGLRDPETGIYVHPDLYLVYPQKSVHQALADCHEELFERSLELPLLEQQNELLEYLEASGQGIPGELGKRQAFFEAWIPPLVPDYLKELFQSNLQALGELLRERNPRVRSGK